MLPKPLTEDICSLRGNVERLAFSVLWEMDAQANALSVRFTKSVIKCVPFSAGGFILGVECQQVPI